MRSSASAEPTQNPAGPPAEEADDPRSGLRADCASCFALCCVALSFARSADFPVDKDAGEPCGNLLDDFRCGIHDRLRPRGFKGCTVFDCFGAGQKVAQRTFGGVSWQQDPSSRTAMFAVFPVMRRLHEMLWYLAEAAELVASDSFAARAESTAGRISRITDSTAEQIRSAPLDELWDEVLSVIEAVSAEVRDRAVAGFEMSERVDLFRADASGTSRPDADLRAVNARGALLVAADLSGADLRWADLAGADLRDARLHGADLSTALFVTQQQMSAAQGDVHTRLPEDVLRPAHWAP